MKKVVIGILVLALLIFGVYKVFFAGKSDGAANAVPKEKPLSISKNSEVFNTSYGKLLDAYFDLKSGLTDYDTVKADAAARLLALCADSLKVNEIKGDSTGTIKMIAGLKRATISDSARSLAVETDLARKKRKFQAISDALYDLTRSVAYDRMKIFHQHCPMAFNDSEDGTWISNSSEVVNPYLGRKHPKFKDKMINCGDVTDSIDFTK
jgi:hypothetical protein